MVPPAPRPSTVYHSANLSRSGQLDVGCGNGYGSHYLAEEAERIEAIDIAEEALTFARRIYRRDNLAFHQASATALPFPDGSFDVASCLEMIEHISSTDAGRLLGEVARVLRPDGLLIVSTPNGALTSHDREHPDNPHHEREYAVEEFERLLAPHFGQIELYAQHASEETLARRDAYRQTDWRINRLLEALVKWDVCRLRYALPKSWREALIIRTVDTFGEQLASRRSPWPETLSAFRVERKPRTEIERSFVLLAVASK